MLFPRGGEAERGKTVVEHGGGWRKALANLSLGTRL